MSNLNIPKKKEDASSNWKSLMNLTGVKSNKRIRSKSKNAEQISRKDLIQSKIGKLHEKVSTISQEISIEEKSIKGFPKYDSSGKVLWIASPLKPKEKERTYCVAIDCEMVGVGPNMESALARVSIVNKYGYCLYDTFVKPKVEVTDYRTEYSGVRESNIRDAPDFDTAVSKVAQIIENRILIGHALENDLRVLMLQHPKHKIRDTSKFYKKAKNSKPSLKSLARTYLKIEIQRGEHNSITDAQTAMKLYLINCQEWERQIKEIKYSRRRPPKKSVLAAMKETSSHQEEPSFTK